MVHILRSMATRFHSMEVIKSSLRPHVNATSAVALDIGDISTRMEHMMANVQILICGDTHADMTPRNMDFVNGKIKRYGNVLIP